MSRRTRRRSSGRARTASRVEVLTLFDIGAGVFRENRARLFTNRCRHEATPFSLRRGGARRRFPHARRLRPLRLRRLRDQRRRLRRLQRGHAVLIRRPHSCGARFVYLLNNRKLPARAGFARASFTATLQSLGNITSTGDTHERSRKSGPSRSRIAGLCAGLRRVERQHRRPYAAARVSRRARCFESAASSAFVSRVAIERASCCLDHGDKGARRPPAGGTIKTRIRNAAHAPHHQNQSQKRRARAR